MAAILSQNVDGQEKVLMYASAPFTKAELNYIPYQKECLAVHWAVLLFHHYISRENFVVRSDCKALEWLKTKPLGDIVAKWYTKLQHYDFEVRHRPGYKSMNVDGLTRQPVSNASCYGVEPFPELADIKPRTITIRAMQTRNNRGGSGRALEHEIIGQEHTEQKEAVPEVRKENEERGEEAEQEEEEVEEEFQEEKRPHFSR